MKQIVLLLFCSLSFLLSHSQPIENINKTEPTEEYDNIHVQKLSSDTHGTSFIIWVKKTVKAHKHVHHTEHIYVISGEATMQLGTSSTLEPPRKITIGPGDYITIPENTVHSVTVTSEMPLKVLSVQTPEFLGTDRVFVK